jgi:hypothetical protein
MYMMLMSPMEGGRRPRGEGRGRPRRTRFGKRRRVFEIYGSKRN